MSVIHSDASLASLIESAGLTDMEAYASLARSSGIFPEATSFRVGGGVATWFSRENVLNGSLALGMSGVVELEEVAALEAFYRDRGTAPQLDLCPLADPSLLGWLAKRGFSVAGFENVLVLDNEMSHGLENGQSGVVVRSGDDVDRGVWAGLEARGFTEDDPSLEERQVAEAISMREDAVRFAAYVDGEPAGAGLLTVRNGIGHLNGDCTLPLYRERGAQQALIAARLRMAEESGCDLVYVETTPGSGSQRNMERAGLRPVYTRVTMVAPLEA